MNDIVGFCPNCGDACVTLFCPRCMVRAAPAAHGRGGRGACGGVRRFDGIGAGRGNGMRGLFSSSSGSKDAASAAKKAAQTTAKAMVKSSRIEALGGAAKEAQRAQWVLTAVFGGLALLVAGGLAVTFLARRKRS